jgi:hypothetical protein
MQCTTIKGDHPQCLICASTVSTSSSPSPPHSPLDSNTPSVPSHLTPPFSPCAGLKASPDPRAASQPKELAPSPSLSSGAVVYAGELYSSITHLPHIELELPTMSGGSPCALGAHGEDLAVYRPVAARCRSCHGGSWSVHHQLLGKPCALQSTVRALCPGQLRWLVGHASKPPIRVG